LTDLRITSESNMQTQGHDSAPESDEVLPTIGQIREDIKSDIETLNFENHDQSMRSNLIAKAVARHLGRIGRWYYHSGQKKFSSSMFFDRAHKLLMTVTSDSFRSWVSKICDVNRADKLWKFIESHLEQVALDPEVSKGIIPCQFWARKDDSLYLSCGDGQMVKISARLIKLVDNGTDGVLFSAGQTVQAWKLVEPKDPFETCSIFREMHASESWGRDLLKLWAFSFAYNPRTKPILLTTGEVGSGKTRVVVAVSELYGLSSEDEGPPCTKLSDIGEGDFWVLLNSGGHTTLDNADTHVRWLPDALATAATGIGSSKRKLFTDDKKLSLRPRSWISITSSKASFASDAGLADRLLVINMERRGTDTADEAISREIRVNRDAGLSFICHTLQAAMADREEVADAINFRHPDWGKFALKLGRAMRMEARAIHCLKSAEAEKAKICADYNEVVQGVLQLADARGTWRGTAAELLDFLKIKNPVFANPNSSYTPLRIAKTLTQSWPHLCTQIRAEKRPGHGGNMVYTFQVNEEEEKRRAKAADQAAPF
jgi:hypothetical protein